MSNHNLTESEIKKLYSPWMLGLCGAGLGINLLLSKLVIFLGLPLYLDNVGSILTGALGGALPGMAVGFLSNAVGSLTTPISLYYGIITVLIAWLSALFSRRGMLKNLGGALIAVGCFVLLGGGLGSVMTWFLYGGGIGGTGEPLARLLQGMGIPAFFCQLTADILIDIPDKLLTVGLSCLALRHIPEALKGKFPLSSLYDHWKPEGTAKRIAKENAEGTAKETAKETAKKTAEGTAEKTPSHATATALEDTPVSDSASTEAQGELRKSVNMRMVTVLAVSMALISFMAAAIGTVYHHQRLVASYEHTAGIFAELAAGCVDGDQVEHYLTQGSQVPGYQETKERLQHLLDSSDELTFLYVYEVLPDGCHVVFDLDTAEVEGQKPGAVVPNEDFYYKNEKEFLQGDMVRPEFTNGRYGSLITVYEPVINSEGKTVAYAGADIDLGNYVLDLMTYIIQLVSVLFAVVLLVVLFTLWYVNQHITSPILSVVSQSRELDTISPESWLESDAWKNRKEIHTGDEIEQLYRTVCKVEENASRNVQKLIETEQQLVQTKELERVNKELSQTIRRADEANRAKTDFLSRMSHDIRTPLNAILGTAALAKEELADPAAMGEYLDTITTAGKFLLGLISDILDINKIESGAIELRPEPFPVDEFIRSVESTIRPLADRKHIQFCFEMNCGHGMILTDKLRYKQIFFNLLSNAIKYTPEGGKVEFIAEALPAPEGMAGVRNIIRDNGIGMTKEYIAHLYEPFTRDKNAAINQTEGSGLGLAIVKNIVDAMDGTITVKSTLGNGTEFVVDLFLPIPKETALPAAGQQLRDETALQGKKILLVEDNAVNIRIARKLLERKGCLITVAEDGAKAVACFAESTPGQFDVILMDIRMPVMDGLEATRRIRALSRSDAQTLPIIAMTANAYAEDVKLSREAGMNAHLSKPIEPEKLYELLIRY